MYMHLTNYSINKFNDKFTENENENEDAVGNKWSFTAFLSFLMENNINTNNLINNIEKIIIKSLISVEYPINHSLNNHVPFRNNCFEIYGYDILLDDTLKP